MITGNTKVDRLILAMAEEEGWYPIGHPLAPNGSASYRRKNPGNLRASPFCDTKENGFCVFKSDIMGIMAFHYDLLMKSKGKTKSGLGPNSTLRELIFKWAPPNDNNNSERYLKNVMFRTGFKETTTLSEIFS